MKRIALRANVAGLGLSAAAGNLASAATLTTLHSFSGFPSDVRDEVFAR